jgi:hypothetical protein
MDLISAGIVFLVFVALLTFSWLARKTWNWLDITFVNLVFLSTVLAAVALSQAYNLRQRDMSAETQARAQLDRAKRDAELALSGDPEASSYGPDSLRAKAQQVRLLFASRGRVWMNGAVTVEGQNNEQRRLTFSTERPAEQADFELSRLKLKDNELYLFADENIIGEPYPSKFIGRVLVVDENAKEILIESVKTGGQEVIVEDQEWSNPSSTWTLYEKMPLDRHDLFRERFLADVERDPESATAEEQELAEAIRNDQLEIGPYRRLLEDRYLSADLLNLDPNSSEYEAIIDSFAFDGFPLGKIENWIEDNSGTRRNDSFVPATDEVFIMYRFNKASNEEYIVDSGTGALTTDGAFTAFGYAVDRSLHHGGPVRFNEGDSVLIDQQTADGERGAEQIPPFRSKEDVTELYRVYVRKLKNYPFLFTNLNILADQAEQEANRVRDSIAVDELALQNARNQERERDKISEGLQQDITHLKNDLQVITQLLERREGDLQRMTAEMETLRRNIRDAYNRLQERTLEIERSAFAGR